LPKTVTVWLSSIADVMTAGAAAHAPDVVAEAASRPQMTLPYPLLGMIRMVNSKLLE
jgi:hypothetical protein